MFGFASKLEVEQLKAQVERLALIVEALQSELKGNKQNDTSLQVSNSNNMKAAKERAKRRAITGNKVTNQPLIFQRQREFVDCLNSALGTRVDSFEKAEKETLNAIVHSVQFLTQNNESLTSDKLKLIDDIDKLERLVRKADLVRLVFNLLSIEPTNTDSHSLEKASKPDLEDFILAIKGLKDE